MDEKEVLKWLVRYAYKTGKIVSGTMGIDSDIHLTAEKLENLCLKHTFTKTVIVEFKKGRVRIFFVTRGVKIELPEEGPLVEELKEKCSREVEYRWFYDDYPLDYCNHFINDAVKLETYGNALKVLRIVREVENVNAAFGIKNDEEHVILHKYRAFIHLILEKKIEKGEPAPETGKRYYLDEGYMLNWIKRYIETIGPIEVLKVRRRVKIKLTLENFDKVLARKMKS